ncbi:MAG: NAD(P)H-dependent oxidoreductase [Bacteroidia bacterium]
MLKSTLISKMEICIISGSARANNNTHRVSLAIEKLLSKLHTVNVIDFKEYDIPSLAQGGMKMSALSSFQESLIHALQKSQVVIMVSPEYNWSATPEILNMLNLVPNKPFDQILNEKVFGFVGVSTGKGGKVPALQMMQIVQKLISFGNHDSIVSPRIFEAHFVKEVLDEEGNSLGNPLFDKGLSDFCTYTLKVAERWFK